MDQITDPVARARSVVGLMMPYELSGGGYNPKRGPGAVLVQDLPWSPSDHGIVGCDCSGFVCYCHRLHRHRVGFNRTPTATVSDDLNTVSMVEDALTARTVFVPVIAPTLGIAGVPQPGDILVYKTIHLPGHPNPWIGHECIVLEVDPKFDPHDPDWRLLKVAQCFGPDHREPAVEVTDGTFWRNHDHAWGNEPDGTAVLGRRSVVIRVRPDIQV